MKQTQIINDFSVLLHKHGPDAKEVEEFVAKYSHFDRFVYSARQLQSVFREKDKVTRIHE